MTDWELTNAALKKVANCELDTRHPDLACARTEDGLIDCQHCPIGYYCGFIVMEGQRKLLEYLINIDCYEEDLPVIMKSMLKQLEASQ